jgi:hypothetical protein
MMEIEQAARAYAEQKFPYIWPLNKEGEKMTQIVGCNPPGSGKAKRQQAAHAETFKEGAFYFRSKAIDFIEILLDDAERVKRTMVLCNAPGAKSMDSIIAKINDFHKSLTPNQPNT